jgi:DNA-binding PadR family transcriptional regulator
MQLVARTAESGATRTPHLDKLARMSLPHALLTALAERPGSGSELAARFDKSIGYFWQATHQQIYRELARLEEAGFVESLPEEATRGRKRAYRLLPAGRKELKRWIPQAAEPSAMRDELMVRLRAEAAIGPTGPGLAKEIRRRLAQHEEKLALYRRIEARDFAGAALGREAALQHLVLQAGIRFEENWIALLGDTLALLGARPGAQPR